MDDPGATCPGALPSRLVPGQRGQVDQSEERSNRLRRNPGLNAGEITRIPPGGRFEVLDGPECANGYAWYQVNYNGQIGWTAESGDGKYWIEALPDTGTDVPGDCTVSTKSEVNMRRGPGTGQGIAGVLRPGETLTIVAKRGKNSGNVWYQGDNGFWMRGDLVQFNGNCEAVPEQ